MRQTALANALIILSVLVLGQRTLGGALFDWGAWAGFVLLCLVGLASNTIRETLLLLASLALGAFLLWRGDGGPAWPRRWIWPHFSPPSSCC